MFNLRGYQLDWIEQVREAWASVRAVLGVLPTGAGKTVCFSSIMHDHAGAAAAVVHRKEIVGQISLALARLGVKHRIVAPPAVVTRIRRRHLKELGKSFVDPHAKDGVISVQTLTSKSSTNDRELQAWLAQVTLAVFDEGHHYVKQGLWARAVEAMGAALLLFVTATPERADGKGLGSHADGFAECMIEGPSVQWLIDQGYLCRFVYKAPATDFNVTDIPITASGDLNKTEMRKRVVESHLVGDVVKHYSAECPGKRAIVFATDVATSEEMAAAFNAAGIPAAALSGETDQGVRDAELDRFESGALRVLVNVDLFDEGFDVPAVDAVILARPTESLAKYLQMVGRALRTLYAAGHNIETREGRVAAIAASVKPFAIVIDAVRNWERGHGLPNWPRKWTMDGCGSNRGPSDTIPQRVCLECTQVSPRTSPVCAHCGADWPEPSGRSLPEQVDGDLFELDVDGMLAMFERQRQADLPDDEYVLDQIARRLPPIARGQDLKRHQTNKYRRCVLRELIAWWVGMQPAGREMREVHRRFFYRFGVDIGTAFELSADDTDALIERIKLKFIEDIAA